MNEPTTTETKRSPESLLSFGLKCLALGTAYVATGLILLWILS